MECRFNKNYRRIANNTRTMSYHMTVFILQCCYNKNRNIANQWNAVSTKIKNQKIEPYSFVSKATKINGIKLKLIGRVRDWYLESIIVIHYTSCMWAVGKHYNIAFLLSSLRRTPLRTYKL